MKVLKIVMVALIICALALTVACGNKDNDNTTMSAITTAGTSTTILNAQNGSITDSSNKGDNGIAGDIVTDLSTMMSTTR